MEKYALVVDSTVYLSSQEIRDFGVKQVSLNIIDKDRTFKELEVTNEFVYEKLDEGHRLTTSQPSPGEFLSTYEELISMGYEKIFVVCLSKHLSGTYQSATLAKNMLEDPTLVYVFESNMAAFGNEMLALEIISMVKDNASSDMIENRINHLLKSTNLIFTVENLVSLFHSGRLSKAKAAIGTVMRIKPLIQMVEGKLDLYKSARTHKKVISEIVDRIKETTVGFKTIHIRILSKNSIEQAKLLEEEIKNVFNNVIISFNEYLGPVFSIHLGKKGYGVSWCSE
ncbi:MAG: DegV family protein [Firmicutes bacterium]|nr:DegV family protein [Bacillota bacterium]